MSEEPRFLFVTCQVGAERAVKEELKRRWPQFRFAFSRPGFLTFKLPDHHGLLADFDLDSVFARVYGFSLEKARGENPEELARSVWQIYGQRPVKTLHVWPRDTAEPGEHDFEPSITSSAVEAREALLNCCPRRDVLAPDAPDPRQIARRGEFVLDCVLVGRDEWWVGYHRVLSVSSHWPGGILSLELPPEAVSRAWLKMEEALRWSRLPIGPGARCVEIGSAPGGSSQALLARGVVLTGIDPAEMHASVLEHPNFTHLRRRAAAVRRRDLRKARWLTADMNVAPNCTLDAIEAIVAHRQISIRGLLLTLKLPDWKLADSVPEYIDRIRGWGYNIVRARQLSHNRREICVAALQQPFRRKPPRPRASIDTA